MLVVTPATIGDCSSPPSRNGTWRRPGRPAPLALLVGVYVLALQAGAPRGRRPRRRAAQLAASRSPDPAPAGGGRLPDRRPRRGLPLLDAHAPARPARATSRPLLLLLALSRVIMRPATRRLMARGARARAASPTRSTGLVPLARPDLLLAHPCAVRRRARAPDVVHALEHASFFTAGLAVWWPLIQPVPMRRRMTGLWPFAYIGAAKSGLAGARPLPDLVAERGLRPLRDRAAHLGPERDRGPERRRRDDDARAVAVVLLVAFVVLFVGMLNQSEADDQRRERLEAAAP